MIADQLDIPVAVTTGDDGLGQMRLGFVERLRRKGTKLIGDMAGIPDAIAKLIKQGLYDAVSVEISVGPDDKPVMTGIALLGAE